MKKLFPVLLAAICLTTVCATAASAAFTTKDTTAYKAATAPVIDGVYDASEGWGDPIVHIVNPTASEYLALCAADHPELLTDPNLIPSDTTVYFRWDDTNFYYCCTTVQEKRSNVYGWGDAGNIWMGDSIVFNFKSTDETESYSRAAVALTDEDGVVYSEYAIEDGTLGFGEYDHWKVTRDEKTKTTTYEMSFKWENAIPDEAVAVGDIVYLRDLLMPATSTDYANPVDFNTAGLAADGSYNYWKITLAEEGAATAAPAAAAEFTTYTEYPETTGTELVYATGDMDMLSGYDAKGGIGVDLFNLTSGGTSYCLKRDTSAWYDFEVAEKTDVTFYVGYVARDGSNRGLDYAVDGGARVFMDIPESAEQQWVSATFTVEPGKHTFYLYAPTGMDDSTLKSCDIYTIELYGTPAAGAAAAEAPAEAVEGAFDYVHYVASGNDPYATYENSIDIDPEVVTWAQIKYRTITEKDSLDNTLTGQIYITPAAEPFIPVKWNHTGNWETIVVDLTSVSEKTTLASLWKDSIGLGFRFDIMESNRDAEANSADDPAVVLPDSAIDIAYIAFFESEDAAKAFDGVNGTPAAFLGAEDLLVYSSSNNVSSEVLTEVPVVEEAPVVEETPVVEEAPAVEEAPVVEETVEEAPAAEEVAEETVEEVVEAPAVEETVAEEAPQTFDFGVIAAVAALVSAAGYALSKKR